MNANSVILGTHGKLYINNVRVANIKSFELTANMNYEDIQVNGNLTMEVHKVDSYNINLVKDAIKTGVMPSIKLVGELSDPNVDGQEAIEVEDVMFDSATLLAFTNGEVRDESTSFRAGNYNYISTID